MENRLEDLRIPLPRTPDTYRIFAGRVLTFSSEQTLDFELISRLSPSELAGITRSEACHIVARGLFDRGAFETHQDDLEHRTRFTHTLTVVLPKEGEYSFAEQVEEAKSEGRKAGLLAAAGHLRGKIWKFDPVEMDMIRHIAEQIEREADKIVPKQSP